MAVCLSLCHIDALRNIHAYECATYLCAFAHSASFGAFAVLLRYPTTWAHASRFAHDVVRRERQLTRCLVRALVPALAVQAFGGADPVRLFRRFVCRVIVIMRARACSCDYLVHYESSYHCST
jgi:cobalamin synthase